MKFGTNPLVVAIAVALAGACGDDTVNGSGNGSSNGSGNGGGNGSGNGSGAPGVGEGVADVSGDASFSVRGPAEWDRTSTSLTVSGTTYTVWSITVDGEGDESELSIRLTQTYDGEAPRVPDDGTFELGSSMQNNSVSVTSSDGDFTSFSNGSVTLEKDATLDAWSLEVSATRTASESLELDAQVEAIPDSGWLRVTVNGEILPLWRGSGLFNQIEPGQGIFTVELSDSNAGDLEVQIQLGSARSPYTPAAGTYALGDPTVDTFELEGIPAGRIIPDSAELVITEFGEETLSGSFRLSAESEGESYDVGGELSQIRYDSL